MSMDFKNRLRNYWFWVSLASFIALLLQSLGYNILPPNYEELVTMFLSLFVMLGILNNPDTSNPGLGDDKEEYMYKIGGSE